MNTLEYGALIRGITTQMNKYIGKISEKYGVNHGQFEYFMMIHQKPGINQIEMARIKNVGKTSVTKAISILEKDGFIQREPSENDKRIMLCSVTTKGNALAEKLLHLYDAIQSNLFAGFSEKDLSLFYQFLNRLSENAHALPDLQEIQKKEYSKENRDVSTIQS
jgi:DNA-binding MarR family transcriptional regulator